ncbi:IMP cyclohydrolase [Patescibacteria group bacterium]|mgnify:CR=1 FL=1|nr:IMP cyclohydrolase [Patescibacteria group bacterium]
MKKAALISVTDKTGIVPLAQVLVKHGIVIVSTGGTAKVLREGGIDVIDVADITGFPSVMDGRLKTLHPKIFGGILFDRDNEQHILDAKSIGVEYAFDYVIVNLYDFSGNPSIETIDIGGPSLLRAAAKNWKHVSVIPKPLFYSNVDDQLTTYGYVTTEVRKTLALTTFEYTENYDNRIANWFKLQI